MSFTSLDFFLFFFLLCLRSKKLQLFTYPYLWGTQGERARRRESARKKRWTEDARGRSKSCRRSERA
jgi:hypothetical protein